MKRLYTKRIIYAAFIFLLAYGVKSEAIETAESTASSDEFTSPLTLNPLRVSIDQVIAITLQKNLSIELVRHDQRIAEAGVSASKGIFDPTLYSSYERSEREYRNISRSDPTLIIPPVLHDTEKLFITSISQLIPTGGVLELSYSMMRFQNNSSMYLFNPYYNSVMHLSGRQPLLKNAGLFVTYAGIKSARITREIVDDRLQQIAIEVLARALKTYWDLVYAIENYEVQKISLEQAEELLRNNRVKFEAGVLPKTDVLQAEARVAERKDNLLIAAKIIRDFSDALKRIMNISQSDEGWFTTLVPSDPLSYEHVSVDETEVFTEALRYRPDISQIEKQKKIAEIEERVSRNKRLPELNIFGTYGFTGTEGDIEKSHTELESLDYNNWSAGVEFIFPILNRRARNEHKQALEFLKQIDTSKEDLIQNIHLEVRNAVRQLNTNWQRIGITQTGVEFETAKLRDELKRFEVGVVTTQDVLEFQGDLARARARHLQAITEYVKSLIELRRVMGTLLMDLGIEIQSTPQ